MPSSPRDPPNIARGSAEAFRDVVHHAVEGILVAEADGSRFLYANPAICTMLGYSAEELLGLGVNDIASRRVADSCPCRVRRTALRRAIGGVLDSVPTPEWKRLFADIRGSPVEFEGVRCNVGFFIDVSERRRAEERLRVQHELGMSLGDVTDVNRCLELCLGAALRATGMGSGRHLPRRSVQPKLGPALPPGSSSRFHPRGGTHSLSLSRAPTVLSGHPTYSRYAELPPGLPERGEALGAIAVVPSRTRTRLSAA